MSAYSKVYKHNIDKQVPVKLNPSSPFGVNKTNLSTSPTGQWTCKCKDGYEDLFIQQVEGGSCDTEIACGAQVPIIAPDGESPQTYKLYEQMDSNGNPIFKDGYVYGNRLTSYNTTRTNSCIVPTTATPIHDGGDKPYTEYTVSTNADPTCIPNQFSNACSIQGPGNIVTTIRGSNNPGDPEKFRVSPPFPPPVPLGIQTCPDTWSGNGTVSNPCLSPDKTTTLAYLTPDGEFLSSFNCIDDVRNKQIGGSYGTSTYKSIQWNTVNSNIIPQPICEGVTNLCSANCVGENEVCTTTYKNNDYVHSTFCVGPECSGASGNKLSNWNGTVDGSLFDENLKPSFVTEPQNQSYGGQCTCDNVSLNPDNITVNEIPAYQIPGGLENESSWWSCITDPCWSKQYPNGKFNGTECICSDGSGTSSSGGDYNSAISWNPTNELPRCISDPCNPGGFATQHSDILREYVGVDCSKDFVCKNNKCWYLSSTPCVSDNDCVQSAPDFPGDKVCNTAGLCLYEDLQRKVYGTKCNCNGLSDNEPCTECAMGTSQDPNTNACSSHCVCGPGYQQILNTNNPVGYMCQEMCTPNPCENNGTCTVKNGIVQCECLPCFTGNRCETIASNGPGTTCESDTDCCEGLTCMGQNKSAPSSQKVCAQWETSELPDQNLPCESTNDCPDPSNNSIQYTCTKYTFGNSCYTNTSCTSNSDCVDKQNKYTGTCQDTAYGKRCFWTDEYVTPHPPTIPSYANDVSWGSNQFQCLEQVPSWSLQLTPKGHSTPFVYGNYKLYRIPNSPMNFRIVNLTGTTGGTYITSGTINVYKGGDPYTYVALSVYVLVGGSYSGDYGPYAGAVSIDYENGSPEQGGCISNKTGYNYAIQLYGDPDTYTPTTYPFNLFLYPQY